MLIRRTITPVLLLIGACLLGAPQLALATGTASGTNISNTVTLDYQVGGVDQDQLSDSTDFVVDNKIDLTVVLKDVAAVTVIPGSTNQVMSFTVRNEGNALQDYSLAATVSAATVFGLTHDFDANNVRIFVDNGDSTFNVADDTDTYIDELAADDYVWVFIVSDIPLAGLSDGDASLYDLTAQTAEGGVVGTQGADITTDDAAAAWVVDTVQIVFADAAGVTDAQYDAQHSSTGAYLVTTAALTVTKTSLVVYDPIIGVYDGVSVFPKAIPGARVQYTIDIDNTGVADADAVTVIDEIPANSYFVVGSVSTTPAVGPGVTVDYANDAVPTWGYVPVDGGDGSDHAVTFVKVTFSTVASTESAQAIFEVLIP